MACLLTLGRFELRQSDSPDCAADVVRMQPKRLALLAYLAVGGPGAFCRRDTLLGLFWPELEQEAARRALRQALHQLRRVLGDTIITRADDQVGLAGDGLRCDAVELERAAAEGRDADVLALYRGDFLDGVYAPDVAQEFEEWVTRTRIRFRHRATESAWRTAESAERAGRSEEAARWARRASELEPDDEGGWRRRIELLQRLGDRAGALRAYDELARRLRTEYGVVPSAETGVLMLRVRAAPVPASAAEPADPGGPRARPAPPEIADVVQVQPPMPTARRRRLPVRRLLAGGIVAVAVLALTFAIVQPPATASVLAVGAITEPQGLDTSTVTHVLPDLITTALARVPGVRVVGHSRLYEVAGDLGIRSTASPALARAARHAGARALLEGVLRHGPGDTLRLDLQLVDLGSGEVRRAYAVAAPNVFALAERSAAIVAEGLLGRSAGSGGGLGSVSLVSRRLYEEGLRAYYLGDVGGARRLFTSALAEDSTFAAAAARLGALQMDARPAPDSGLRLLQRAARLSHTAPDEERLEMTAVWMAMTNDPRALATAETLSTRYPHAPVAHLLFGAALVHAGDFVRAVPPLRRAIELDSMSLTGLGVGCRACEAYAQLTMAYVSADSLAAAERAVREWIRRQPASPWPWRRLADVVSRSGRYAEAHEALRRARAIEPGADDQTIGEAAVALRADSVALAERLLRSQLREAGLGARDAADAEWWLGITLRTAGRLREAQALAAEVARTRKGTGMRHEELRAGAIVARELGEYETAAATYTIIGRAATSADSIAPSTGARHRALSFTLVGDAVAAAGDTVRLARLADSVERFGQQSGFARDRRLHWHLRGLLARARGRPDEAEANFRRAFYSASESYAPTNLELARLYLESERPAGAIGILRSALHGPTESGNSYTTRTELHDLIARAFDAAGMTDSAIAHYRIVARSWGAGDPPFRVRANVARARAEVLARR